MSDSYYVTGNDGQPISAGGGDIYIDNSNVQIITGTGEILLQDGSIPYPGSTQVDVQVEVGNRDQQGAGIYSDAYDIYEQATMPSTRDGGAQRPAPQDGALPPEDTSQAPIPEARDKVEGQVFGDSANRPLTATDLQGLSADQIKVARNEIYARHGYSFGDEQLRNHFQSQSWYKEDPNWDGRLSRMEERNVMFLQNHEFENNFNGARDRFRGAVEQPADTTGMIMPDSATKMVTSQQLDQMSVEDIRLARNEMFARHGYQFGYPDMALHFERQPWYRRDANYQTENLSWLEHRNINQIAIYEFDNNL